MNMFTGATNFDYILTLKFLEKVNNQLLAITANVVRTE